MIYFLAPKGRCGVKNYVAGRWRHSDYPEIQCLSYEDVFSWPKLPSGTWIFMGVEQLPPAGKRLAETVWQALTNAAQTVLNRPKLLLSRHALLDTMYRAEINEFHSHLPSEIDETLRYPVFVRQAEQHTGSMSGLITDRKKLESFLRRCRLVGYSLHELLIVEFCDTVNELGEYRKYSTQSIQGEVSARYLHIDKQWMVKAHSSTFRDEWAYEELEFIRHNSHAAEAKKIFELANVEYGRIDYGLLNGKLQVWEINTNPTIGATPREVATMPQNISRLQKPGRKLFFERFQSMLESIDSPHEPEVIIELMLAETDLRNWREEVRAIQRLRQRRKLLRKLSLWLPVGRVRDIAKYVLGVTTRQHN